MSDLVGNPKDRFSHNEAHISVFLYLQFLAQNIYQIKIKNLNLI